MICASQRLRVPLLLDPETHSSEIDQQLIFPICPSQALRMIEAGFRFLRPAFLDQGICLIENAKEVVDRLSNWHRDH